ncbi:MAG: hypothetical protein WD294_12805 [Phycisphaeraceae bacterium]
MFSEDEPPRVSQTDNASQQRREPSKTTEPSRKRRRWFWPAVIGGGVLVALLIVVALIPTLLSTGPGSRYIAGQVSDGIQGEVRIGTLSLSWFGAQSAGDVVVLDAQGRETLQIDQADTQLSVWNAMRGNYHLGRTQLTGVRADVIVDEAGENNLAQALSGDEPADPDAQATVPRSLRFDLSLAEAQVTLHTPDVPEPIVFEDIDGEAAMASLQDPLSVQLAGRSRLGDAAGSFSADGRIANLFADDGTVTFANATGAGTAEADDLPVPGIDRLVGMEGLLTDALGDLANLSLTVDTEAAQPQFAFAAQTPRLRTQFTGVVNDQGAAAIDEPANVNMDLNPELAQRLFGLELTEPVPVELQLTDLRTPVAGFDPNRTAVTGTVRILQPAEFLDEQQRPVTLTSLEAAIASTNIAEALELELTAELDVEDEQGDVQLAGTINDLYNAEGQLQWDQVQADLVAQVNNLPTVFVDRLAQQDGLLLEALGDRFSLRAETESVGADQIAAQLTLTSPRLTTETLNLAVDADWITLTEPVGAEMLIAPRVASAIVGAVTLAEPEPADMILRTLRAPRPAAGEPFFQPARTQIDFELAAQRPVHLLDVPELEEAMAENLNVQLAGPSLADLRLTLRALLDDVDDPAGQITTLAGSPIDAVLQVDTGVTDAGLGDLATVLTLDADLLDAQFVGTIAQGWSAVTVTEPSTLNMLITREMLAAFDLEEQVDQAMLSGPLQLAMTVDQLRMPLPLEMAQLEMEAVADVTAQQPGQRSDAFVVWLGEQARVNVQAQPAGDQQSRLALAINADRMQGDLLADFTQVEERTAVTLVEPATFQATLSEAAVAALNAMQGEDAEPLLIGETAVTLALTELDGQVQPLLWTSLTAEAEMTSDRVQLAAGALPGQEQVGQVEGVVVEDLRSQLRFNGAQNQAQLQLSGTTWVADQAEPGSLQIDAVAEQIIVDNELALADADIQAEMQLEQVPTRLVAGFIEYQPLVPLLGPLANLTATGEWDGFPPREGVVDAEIQSANLTADLPFRVTDGILELVRPARSVLTVTPEAYDAVMAPEPADEAPAPGAEAPPQPQDPQQPPLGTLTEPGDIQLELQSLRWPLPTMNGGEEVEPREATQLSFVGALSSEALTFASTGPDEAPATLSFNLQFDGEDLSQPSPYQFTGQIQPAAPRFVEGDQPQQPQQPQLPEQPAEEEDGVAAIPTPEGSFQFAGTVANLVDSLGQPTLDAMRVDLQGEANDLPVGWLDQWTAQEGMLLATLGPQLDLEVSGQLQQFTGPISLLATSTNGSATVVGNLQDGVFQPTQPITASLQVTQQMGDRVLRSIHPIFETAVSGPDPIALNIPVQGVSIPVQPFDLTQANIPVANLAVGQLSMRQGGTLAAVLTGLERLVRQDLEAGEIVEAWFTPAVFELSNGQLRYQRRLDILLDQRIQLATWGQIDLANNTVDLSLGLPAAMLERMFGVDVPEGSVFTIPMRGNLEGVPQMDWGRAATDMGRLVGQAELAEQSPIAGAILGDVFSEILETQPPPPSVSPLPWADVPLEPAPEAAPPEEEPTEPEEDEPRAPSLRDLLERIR